MNSLPAVAEPHALKSFSTRFWLEWLGNSAHFPIANIILELVLEKPLDYLRAPDVYALIAASMTQAYWLTRWQDTPRPRRFWGNLIAPLLYTLIEGAMEGSRFFGAAHHLAYWVFAAAIGTLQELSFRAPPKIRSVLTLAENLLRTSILFFMYILAERYTNPLQTTSLSAFFRDETHIFMGGTILFLGLVVSLANLTAQHYQQILAEETRRRHERRLREFIEMAPFGALIYELQPDDRLLLVGANEIARSSPGLDLTLLHGKPIEEVFPGLAKTNIPAAYRRVAREGRQYRHQQILSKENHAQGIYEVVAVQIQPGAMAAFFHDVTELTEAYDMTLEGWSRALDLRDNETEGHTQRVTTMACQIARAMNLSEEEIQQVRRGALLHDIGKMAIPDSILFKRDKLSEEEWAIMRKHPEFAYEMLSPIAFLRPALEIPYCHHEKWDGTGYPRGLQGEAIPIKARIFAVADVWDALTYGRRYREAWPEERVKEYFRQQAGKHFDPQVVEVFLKLLEERRSL
jgi:putative nucleotidyltransferase with HDIG domain